MRSVLSLRAARSNQVNPRLIASRNFHSSPRYFQERSDPAAHRNFYKTHGRAMAKTFTLAFFSYQVFYWIWLTFETEAAKDAKNREVKSLEGEVRLLEEGRSSHSPGTQLSKIVDGKKV